MSSNRLRIGLALVAALGGLACRRSSDLTPVVELPQAQSVASVGPTGERLLQRANRRWAWIAAKDWGAAYEYLTAEQRATVPLEQFLKGKQYHEYSHPRAGAVLATAADEAFVRVFVTWKPLGRVCRYGVNARLDRSVLDDDRDAQEIEMYERWRRLDGEWFYVRAQRPDEFFEEHPNLREPR